MRIKAYVFQLTFFLLSQQVLSQDTIVLINPSFEGVPHKGAPGGPEIYGWKDCGTIQFPNTSPPDLHPVAGARSSWGVGKAPYEGVSYLGMVVRSDHSWESVGQRLNLPLKAGHCYSFSAALSMSDMYASPTKATHSKAEMNATGIVENENFLTPTKLVIWGGHSMCDRQEVLAESIPVDNKDWQRFDFVFHPLGNYKWLTIGAYYIYPDYDFNYNGHLLLDNLSAITEVTCD